jgi:HAD superfamily hydrolase (TIGR01549 family)
MAPDIQAVFLDTGNTMRLVVKNSVYQNQARGRLVELLGIPTVPPAFFEKLEERYAAYKNWAKETLIQVSETELWTKWLLPDYPAEKIAPLAGRLTIFWLEQLGRRTLRPDVKPTIVELYSRGYLLGIIANSISETEIPVWLQANDLAQYFQVVLLSSVFGRLKPDPSVFVEAARLAGLDPARCAYLGDNPTRDIRGARQAGFGRVIILLEPATLKKDPPQGTERPDGIISEFNGLLSFFPSRAAG